MQDTEKMIRGAVDKILALDENESIEFIFLYGSVSLGREHKGSDIDLCIGFKGNDKKAFDFILKTMSAVDSNLFDIKLFRQLPLYIRVDVFKGNLLYFRDLQKVYSLAYDTIEDYEEFKPHFYDYIGKEVMH